MPRHRKINEAARQSNPAIVVLGGGNGASNLLKELKTVTSDLTAIVTTFDNGGSSGRLRAEYNMPAPGDIRRCLAALGNNESQNSLFNKRLKNGHTVGNLILCDLTRQLGSFDLAVEEAARRLDVTGRVLPVCSYGTSTLVVHHHDKKIKGEYQIGTSLNLDLRAHVYLEPEVGLHPSAATAIKRADMIIVAPGSLLTSLGAVLAPLGIKKELRAAQGLLVNVANLTTEGSSKSWHVADHIKTLQKYTGRPFDIVIYNNDLRSVSGKPLGIEPEKFKTIDATAIGSPLAGKDDIHDAKKVALQISRLAAIKRDSLVLEGVSRDFERSVNARWI